MRIALFTDTFPPTLNGVARALGLLVEHANRQGHEVGVVSTRESDDAWPGTAFHIRLPGVRLPFYKELQAAQPVLGRNARRLLKGFRPHIVHSAVEALVGMAGRRWARENGVPFVSSYCTNFPEYLAGYGLGLLEGAAWSHLRRFHGAARLTFCPSAATLRDLQARGFHPRLRIWGRGVDSDLFHPSRRDPTLRERMAPGAEVILLYVGRIAPEKRVDLLLEAFPHIRDAASGKVALVFVGGGPALEGIRRRGLEGVYFAGYQRGEVLAAHFASADAFLFASDSETFGQVVTEAMASGLPVVAPARGGVLDTVVPGETGFLFPPGDVAGLVEAGLRLVEDPALRGRLGRGARAATEDRSWDAVFRRLFRDYAEAAGMWNASVTNPPPDHVHGPANVLPMEQSHRRPP